ncbi:hypothetical protein DICVIV_05056 [Dictyocaulus viviparus]|uniref:Uncharacterized protein n=1 Tax=Dictyocaulus viviparus TaxID=29172 RepID=A0A0D8XW00_DICVI|nr:hypothetical protein DICVIV_05056 [Dictyocaulus viviparus]
MTSLGRSSVVIGLSNHCNMSTPYPIIRESVGKRHGDLSKRSIGFKDDDDAPRAKRRFERMSAQLERFSISDEEKIKRQDSMETLGSDDEYSSNDGFMKEQSTEAIIEEPDEDQTSRVVLDHYLQDYIDRMKQSDNFGLPTRDVIRGNELVIWRPLVPPSDPFLDPTMKGRIQEVDNTAGSSCEVSTSNFITEEGDSDSDGEIRAQIAPLQPFKPQIEDVTFQDDECFEMECD